MTATTDFIAELVKAANEVGKLTGVEKQRLLTRGVATIREMRLQTGMRAKPGGKDPAVAELLHIAGTVDGCPNHQITRALLECADMIRTLKIVLDAKGEILRGN